MSRQSTINLLVILLAILAGLWRLILKPRLELFGYNRLIEAVNNQNCKVVPELSACEKIVLHQPSGLLYLACSTPSSRVHWTPALAYFNETGASFNDYVASYDPKTSRITRFKVVNFESDRGLSLHGMDVVPSSSNASELLIYLINHRAPLGGLRAKDVGADSVVEIFKTTLGGDTLTHIKTVQDPVIFTPNDIVGSPDGKSFYFTNDHGEKVGLARELDLFGRKSSSIGYCDVDNGCHYAIRNMNGNNGIVRAPNGTFYVANCMTGGLYILDEQADHTLVLIDVIPTDRGLDNVSIDSAGNVWAAGFPNAIQLTTKHFKNPSISSPSSALRFSINTNPAEIMYGKKYRVEKMFEDNGSIASGTTSVSYDAERKLLFLSGLSSPQLAVCKL